VIQPQAPLQGGLLGAQDVITGTQDQPTAGLNESYSYDPFGNLQQSGNFNFVQAYTTANRISGYNYDLAGNLLADGLGNTYTWDANEMISSSNGTSYFYDAEGSRVGKAGSSPTDTIYFGGRPVARLAGGAWTDLIYGAGGLLAEVPGTQTGAPVYRMTDPLGSSVGMLSSTGALSGGIQDYAPFGELFNGSSTSDPYKFTGKERDAESGNDYFGARYYNSAMGRFMSPDWSAKVEPVPYSKLDDPQSLNLYAYVLNNPLIRTDADGHDPGISHEFDFVNCSGTDPQSCDLTEQDKNKEQINKTLHPGFWSWLGHGLSNLAHFHSWNYIKATAEGFDVGPHIPVVTGVTDAAGLLATATKITPLGVASSIGSVANDHSAQNVTTNMIGLYPPLGWQTGITGTFIDLLDYKIHINPYNPLGGDGTWQDPHFFDNGYSRPAGGTQEGVDQFPVGEGGGGTYDLGECQRQGFC